MYLKPVLPKKNILSQIVSLVNLSAKKKITPILYGFFQKIEEEGTLHSSFYELHNYPDTKSDEDIVRKVKFQYHL